MASGATACIKDKQEVEVDYYKDSHIIEHKDSTCMVI